MATVVSIGMGAAHRRVLKGVKSGALVRPDTCEECGIAGRKIHAHHEDYNRPLDVRWLCRSCHNRWHLKNGPGKNRSRVVSLDRMTVTTRDKRRLAGEVNLDIRTVAKWLAGERVLPAADYALKAAAKRLKIDVSSVEQTPAA